MAFKPLVMAILSGKVMIGHRFVGKKQVPHFQTNLHVRVNIHLSRIKRHVFRTFGVVIHWWINPSIGSLRMSWGFHQAPKVTKHLVSDRLPVLWQRWGCHVLGTSMIIYALFSRNVLIQPEHIVQGVINTMYVYAILQKMEDEHPQIPAVFMRQRTQGFH